MEIADMPKNSELAQLVAQVIRKNGGIATNEQIRNEVIGSLGLSDVAVATIHSGTRTEIEYRLAWARTIAKKKNLIKSSGPKQWSSVE
jgi:restriction system protein